VFNYVAVKIKLLVDTVFAVFGSTIRDGSQKFLLGRAKGEVPRQPDAMLSQTMDASFS